MNVEVVIEVTKGSNIKYEYDHKNNKLICDRILHTPMNYFFNYGYIENTLSPDGDPIDVVVLCKEKLMPTCYINCKILGVLYTEDEKGLDPKIITVPSDKIDPESKNINNISDISKDTLNKLKFFFQNYKKLEPNKWVNVTGWGDNKEACELIKKSPEEMNIGTQADFYKKMDLRKET